MKRPTPQQIEQLKIQGCHAQAWDKIYFKNTDVSLIHNVFFVGNVIISGFNGECIESLGVRKRPCLFQVTLRDVAINGNVIIRNVAQEIANYTIEEGVVIENVGALIVEGITSFGNGTEISPMIESGGREITLFDELDAQTAYILTFYRHHNNLQTRIKSFIAKHCYMKTSETGLIDKKARIVNTLLIKNTHVGPSAVIENASEVKETTLVSTSLSPSYIGAGCIVRNSILLKGSYVSDNSIVTHSLVGEGVKLIKQFSSDQSLFFANSEGQHGEACSVFAGPYTVTHHKATLLIAGHFSFYNAGSGTNQSNHMYRLGPCHQGFMERGCKTSSNSYLRLPYHIAAFSTVLGSHYRALEAEEFPFSRIFETDDHKSHLMPSLNLFSVGLCRDESKWQKRDRRKEDKKDLITFEVFSPYTVSKMIQAEKILGTLKISLQKSDSQEFIAYKGMLLKQSLLEKYQSRYQIAIDFYLHDKLLGYLKESQDFLLESFSVDLQEPWVDIAGLITPRRNIEQLIEDIHKGIVDNLDDLRKAWQQIHHCYFEDERQWVVQMFCERFSCNFSQIQDPTYLSQVLQNYTSLVEQALDILQKDIQKEFGPLAQISFGVDWQESREKDFEQVRGSFLDNPFSQEYTQILQSRVDSFQNWIKTFQSS